MSRNTSDPNAVLMVCGVCSFCAAAGGVAVLMIVPHAPIMALVTVAVLTALFSAGGFVWHRRRTKAPATSDISPKPENSSQVVSQQGMTDGQSAGTDTSESASGPPKDV